MSEDYHTRNTFFIVRDLHHARNLETCYKSYLCSNVLNMMGIDAEKSCSECAHDLESKIKLVQKTDNVKNVVVNIKCYKINNSPTGCYVDYMSDNLSVRLNSQKLHKEP